MTACNKRDPEETEIEKDTKVKAALVAETISTHGADLASTKFDDHKTISSTLESRDELIVPPTTAADPHPDGGRGVLQCDYLVVGAGTAGMSFIDALLTQDSDATVTLVDRNSQAGGHWTTAYPFVRLHQPGCNYGVNSLPLGRAKDSRGREKYDINDRATGKEIVEYYGRVAKQFVDSGRVQIFFNSEYREDNVGGHIITDTTTGEVHRVACTKVVTVNTNILVPSMRDGPPFPVHSNVQYVPVNELPSEVKSGRNAKYVIIGAGKTGSDAITYLLQKGVDQSNITWIVSRDVWYFMRDGYIRPNHTYWQDAERLLNPLDKASTIKDVFLAYEEDGIVARLDPDNRPYPEVFKFPMIDTLELDGLRSIQNVVRMGRVASITNDSIVLGSGSVPLSSSDTLVVDCMADLDGDFCGYIHPVDFRIFEPGRINLGPLIALFNSSFSSAIIAYIEAVFEDDDMMKNGLLYFPQGEHAAPTPLNFFSKLYAQKKTFAALGKYPPANEFLLGSRTNAAAPMHHGGVGPPQIVKKGDVFVAKLESGGFADVKDCFGNGRPAPDANMLKVKKQQQQPDGKGEKGRSEVAAPYPPEKPKTNGFK